MNSAEGEPEEEEADEGGEDEGAEEDGGEAAAGSRWGDEFGVAVGAALGGGGDVVSAGFAVGDELVFGLDENGGDGGEEGAGPKDDHVGEEACDAEDGGDEAKEETGEGGAAGGGGAAEAIGGRAHGW